MDRGKKNWCEVLTLLALALLISCSKDNAVVQEPTPEGVAQQAISFVVTHEGEPAATRATTFTDDASLTAAPGGSFTCFAYVASSTNVYINGSTVSYAASSWSFDEGKHYWPATGNLDFFTYMPATKPTYIGDITYSVANGPSFVCSSLPVTSATQANVNEFIYAIATNQAKGNDVALAYKHPFATISVRLLTSHNAVYQLNSITFKSIKNNGTYTLGNVTQWVSSGEATDLVFSIEGAVSKAISEDADFTNDQLTAMHAPFLVMPQTLSGTDQIEVNLIWNYGNDAVTLTYDNPVAAWEAGKSYTYTIDLAHPK